MLLWWSERKKKLNATYQRLNASINVFKYSYEADLLMATVQMYVRFGECDLFLKCRFLWSIAWPLKVCTMGLCNEIQYVGLSVIHLIDRLTYYFIDTLLIRDFCSIFRNTRCKSEVKLLQPTRFYVISMSSCIIEFHAKTISTNFCSIYLQFKTAHSTHNFSLLLSLFSTPRTLCEKSGRNEQPTSALLFFAQASVTFWADLL